MAGADAKAPVGSLAGKMPAFSKPNPLTTSKAGPTAPVASALTGSATWLYPGSLLVALRPGCASFADGRGPVGFPPAAPPDLIRLPAVLIDDVRNGFGRLVPG